MLPIAEYCSVVWNPSTTIFTAKVERVQNYAARLILDKPLWTSSKELPNTLTLDQRCFQHAKLTYKILNKQSPSYLYNKFDLIEMWAEMEEGMLISSTLNEHILVKNSFHYKATKIWNSLDHAIRHASSLRTFVSLNMSVFPL